MYCMPVCALARVRLHVHVCVRVHARAHARVCVWRGGGLACVRACPCVRPCVHASAHAGICVGFGGVGRGGCGGALYFIYALLPVAKDCIPVLLH
jgi:hypothetical protein